MSKGPIQKWGDKVNWNARVKAVCKPCWEIKYCPYGPLVEDFPLKEVRDEKSCRIFGHDCPVFYVAEPFTETKELRRISRPIPRVTQFRVMKRENQICRSCGKSVQDEDIEFDHIIPWSKGGSSEESNIRLLCGSCNKTRGNNFESELLIDSLSDHLSEPEGEQSIDFLKMAISFGHDFLDEFDQIPEPQDYADHLSEGDLTIAEDYASNYYKELTEFFSSPKPKELSKIQFDSIKHRWGFIDGSVHKLKYTAELKKMDIEDIFLAEKNLVQRLGMRMKETKTVENKWKKK